MSIILARQGANKTLNDFRTMMNYSTDDIKTKAKKFTFTFGCITEDPLSEMIALKKLHGKTNGRQYTQTIISPTPVNNSVSDEEFMEMAKEIGKFYYNLGFQCNVSVHFDTGKRHIHLVINSVSLLNAKKFSQSISQLNRFKVHCNRVFEKYGFDIIKMPTEKILDDGEYSFNDGYDFLEAYDEIAQDIAFNFYNICENNCTGYALDEESSNTYENPDYPRDSYNHFFAAESETYREYYSMGPTNDNVFGGFHNAFGAPSELRPIPPFNSADLTPAIIIKEQSSDDNVNINYFEDMIGSSLHIDYSQKYDISVPETVRPEDIDSIISKIPLRSEKEKNDAIRSASAAKAALERKGNQSQVLLDVSEKISVHFNDETTSLLPDQKIVNVDYEEID